MAIPRLFFAHTMKTGGTSMLGALRQELTGQPMFPPEGTTMALDNMRMFTSVRPILELTIEQRRQLRLVHGHVPASVGSLFDTDTVRIAIVRDPVDRTISQLRHCQRFFPGLGGSLDELYDDPWVFGHLVHEHQTRMLSMTLEESLRSDETEAFWSMLLEPLPAVSGAPLAEMARRLAVTPPPDVPSLLVAWGFDLDAATARTAEVISTPNLFLASDAAVCRGFPADDGRLDAARHQLDGTDVVGVTDRHPDLMASLNRRLGLALATHRRDNVAEGDANVPSALRRRIAEDNPLDAELYAHARDLVDRRR